MQVNKCPSTWKFNQTYFKWTNIIDWHVREIYTPQLVNYFLSCHIRDARLEITNNTVRIWLQYCLAMIPAENPRSIPVFTFDIKYAACVVVYSLCVCS